jgi:peptidoglycan-associated lipoprotein
MNRTMVPLGVVLVLGGLLLTGCPKKADVSSAPEAVAPAAEPSSSAAAEAAARRAEEEQAAKDAGGLKPVYFDYDRSVIRDDAKPVMKANVEWLKAHPAVAVRIEGNCDERGTIEYNQALGQRRAAAAKRYLVDLGIPSSRITLISYGKDKPSCTDSTEDCWQQNRRGDFAVTNN